MVRYFLIPSILMLWRNTIPKKHIPIFPSSLLKLLSCYTLNIKTSFFKWMNFLKPWAIYDCLITISLENLSVHKFLLKMWNYLRMLNEICRYGERKALFHPLSPYSKMWVERKSHVYKVKNFLAKSIIAEMTRDIHFSITNTINTSLV